MEGEPWKHSSHSHPCREGALASSLHPPPHPLGSMLGKWQGAQDQKKKLERPKRKKPTKEEGIDYRSPGFRNVTFTERISRRLTFDSLGIRGTGGEVETGIWFGFWRWRKKRAWRTEVGSAGVWEALSSP